MLGIISGKKFDTFSLSSSSSIVPLISLKNETKPVIFDLNKSSSIIILPSSL